MELERRTFVIQEMRVAAAENEPVKIEGYAAVFNSLSDDLGGFREQIFPGAFVDSLEQDDIRALFNHDPNFVLGRNTAGTLALNEDAHGLKISILPPDTEWARGLTESIRRGDIDQMSFGFRTISDNWHMEEQETIRDLLKVQLFDVSPVTYPAYPQTVVSARDIFQQSYQPGQTVSQQDPAPVQMSEEAISEGRMDILRKKLETAQKAI